ncbi:MAG: polyphosphate kinase 2 family protein [Alphaproteobacteria bacterium]|nr:polyphosphate kinase 2 family protein [Alphaproteobacteria bacterium]
MDWRTIDACVRVDPGKTVKLADHDPGRGDVFPDKKEAEKRLPFCAEEINKLQDRLWAERSRALLIVLQGIDTSGKDGTVRSVFNACGPLGVQVTGFGRPTEVELAHDYLWRVHGAAPKKGMIGIFNRSHYEDVLVVKVHGLAPEKAIEQRYDQINAFEKHLVENGTTILKFMLHISKDEQKQRLEDRLSDSSKHWKFNPGDLDDRKRWDDFQKAYEIMLRRCSTEHAPWRVIPSDKKWRRNAIIAAITHGVLDEMNPAYPDPTWKPGDFTIE